MAKSKVLIMAGGTGGHVFPGLAVARELINRNIDVEWLGTAKGIEATLVPQANLALYKFPVSGVRGKGMLALLLAPFNIMVSVWAALKIIHKIKPNLVIGMGGFVSGPGGIAAKILRIPVVIHEQNAVIGTTNRLLSVIANKVFTAFPFSGSRYTLVGNPVRAEIENMLTPEERRVGRNNPVHVLVLGGSRGALALNTTVPKILEKVAAKVALDVFHQCGESKENSAQQAYESTALNVKITPFISDMVEAFTWADFVICRAGALTIAELSAVGLGSLLIPYPYAIDDHQTANAKYLVDNNAALLIQEKEINCDEIAHKLTEIFIDRKKILSMANNARSQAQINSAVAIASFCEELIHA